MSSWFDSRSSFIVAHLVLCRFVALSKISEHTVDGKRRTAEGCVCIDDGGRERRWLKRFVLVLRLQQLVNVQIKPCR